MKIIRNFGAQFAFCPPYVSGLLRDYDSILQCSNKIFKKELSVFPDELLLGFKLMLAVNLHAMVKGLITHPNWFDVELDNVLLQKRFWSYDPLDDYPVLSNHGILIRNLLECKRKILSATTWEELKTAHNFIVDYLDLYSQFFNNGYSVALESDNKKSKIELKPFLTKLTLSYVVVQLGDPKYAKEAYRDIYHSPRKMTIQRVMELEKEWARRWEDQNEYKIPFVRRKQDMEGYIIAFIYLVQSLMPKQEMTKWQKLFPNIISSANFMQFRQSAREVYEEIVKSLEEEWGFGYAFENLHFQRNPFPNDDLKKRLLKPMFKYSRKKARLNELFMYKPVRLVQYENSISGAHFFHHVFNGVLSLAKRNEDKIPIIRFIHPEPPGNGYSYAIFMPSYGTVMADCSEWWMFYNSFSDYSGTGGQAFRDVEKLIHQNKKFVKIETAKIHSSDSDFISLLESHKVKLLRTTLGKLWDVNRLSQGILLELLAALYFTRMGYSNVVLRKPSKVIKGRHIDISAIKENKEGVELALIECKGKLSALPEFALREELRNFPEFGFNQNLLDVAEFGKDVENISKNAPEYINEAFNIQKNVSEITGIVISTTLINDAVEKYIPSNLEFWSWKIFRKKLQHVGISGEIYAPLEKLMLEEFDITHSTETIELEEDTHPFE